MKGAEVIFHINNAVKPDDKKREALLISRAFENQCWVCSVNNAAPSQTMRSMVINPVGDVIWASEPTQEEVKAIDLDLTEIQNVYIEQARTDLVSIKEPE
jgi:predicted amidohydrolase